MNAVHIVSVVRLKWLAGVSAVRVTSDSFLFTGLMLLCIKRELTHSNYTSTQARLKEKMLSGQGQKIKGSQTSV